MRKFTCLLLVVALFLFSVSCAKTEKEVGKDVTTTIEEVNPFEEFFEITWLTQNGPDYKDGRWDELELEEMFNVDLQVWPMESTNAEQMAAIVAAGDIPDFFYAPGLPREPQGMYDEKLIRSVPLDMIKSYLPGQYEVYERVPIGFKYNLVNGKTDEYLGITCVQFNACQYFYDITGVNLDWLEAVGYDFDDSELVPVKMTVEGYEQYNDNIFFTEGNLSFDDMNEILRAFTEDDPDGNGIDDTYGMLYLPESAWTNMTQEGLFGFVHDLNYKYEDPVTGNIVPKYAYTPYKDYLKWVSDNLNKGYMVPQPKSGGWAAQYQEMSGTNKYGIYGANGGGYLSLNSDTYRVYPPQNILLSVDDSARFVIGPMFRGPEGILVDATYGIDPYGTGKSRVQMVGAQVDDGKLERLCAILQHTTYSSKENLQKYVYGIEGVHYKWAGEPYKSTMLNTAAADLPEEYRGRINVFVMFYAPSAIQQQIDNAKNYGYWAYMPFMHANGLFEKYALNPIKYTSEAYMGIELFREYEKDNTAANEQLNPIINDFKSRALKGEIADFNTEWTQYIDQLYANGLQDMIDKYYNNPDFKNYDPGLKFTIRE